MDTYSAINLYINKLNQCTLVIFYFVPSFSAFACMSKKYTANQSVLPIYFKSETLPLCGCKCTYLISTRQPRTDDSKQRPHEAGVR